MKAPSLFRLVMLEIRMLALRPLCWWIAGLLMAAMLVAAASGARQAGAERAAIAHARTEEVAARDRAQAVVDHATIPPEQYRDPTDPYGYLFYFARVDVTRTTSARALLATGDSDLRPPVLRITPGQGGAQGAGTVANQRVVRIGRFDLAFVLVALVPLALIAMSGTVISAERDAGQWPLLASQPAGGGRIALARFAALALVTIPAVLVMALVALNAALPREGWAPLAWLALDLAGFMLFWLMLAAGAAALRIEAAASLIALVLIWALMLFGMPQLGIWCGPVPPSRIAGIEASRQAAARFDADPAKETGLWLARRGIVLPEAARQRADLQRLALDDLVWQAQAGERRDVQQFEDAMLVWQERLATLSPMLAMERALLVAAGRDAAVSLRMTREAARCAHDLEQAFVPVIVTSVKAQPVSTDRSQALADNQRRAAVCAREASLPLSH